MTIQETSEHEINSTVRAARDAFSAWSHLALSDRITRLNILADEYRKSNLVETICRETGKPKWESRTELDAMTAKIPISIEAYNDRCKPTTRTIAGATGTIRFRPHGVLAVLGPFNMPGHLPNGHIVPALLAGNAVVFKPSEKTPQTGQLMADAAKSAGLPLFLVQGTRQTAEILVQHPDINGVLFTGGTSAGKSIARLLADSPEKLLALEMGGNNPLIVHEVTDLDAAAAMIVQSAYITSGQRCSCARRLILCRGKEAESLLDKLRQRIAKLRLGFWTDNPEPFMGPVISQAAADQLLNSQRERIALGGVALVEMKQLAPALLSPGLIDVTAIPNLPDVEIFGPLLQVIQVNDSPAAIREANRTAYGLSAGLLSDNESLYQQFLTEIRAGVIHWNRPLTGASSALPFGGTGQSGNHRAAGYSSADYSAHPVACLEMPRVQLPKELPPGM